MPELVPPRYWDPATSIAIVRSGISHFGLDLSPRKQWRVTAILLTTAYLCGFQRFPLPDTCIIELIQWFMSTLDML